MGPHVTTLQSEAGRKYQVRRGLVRCGMMLGLPSDGKMDRQLQVMFEACLLRLDHLTATTRNTNGRPSDSSADWMLTSRKSPMTVHLLANAACHWEILDLRGRISVSLSVHRNVLDVRVSVERVLRALSASRMPTSFLSSPG